MKTSEFFMNLQSWIRKAFAPEPRTIRKASARFRPTVETLEDRRTPATLTVSNLEDAGAGSLRQAILDANDTTTHPGADVIEFDSGMSGTIELALGEMSITDDLAIIGPGASTLR